MEVDILSRIQFALTAGFHFLFPPISIGFSVFIVAVEALWLKTGDERYKRAAMFFLKLFGLIFAVGVVTGIVMVFQFGTNWPIYSNFVGDVFGSPLAIEAVFAFFMESTFLAIALWGWDRVSRKAHFFATVMVCIGTHLSAIWIIAANSFMQTPAGFKLEMQGFENGAIVSKILPDGYVPSAAEIPQTKAVITDFVQMALSPSMTDRLTHTVAASWLSGAFLALGICAYYVLRRRKDVDFAKPCLKVGLVYALFGCVLMLYTGHGGAKTLATTQPEKLAAFEGHYETMAHAPLYLVGWVDEDSRTVYGFKADGWLSLLAFNSFSAEVKGLNDLPDADFIKSMNKDASAAQTEVLRPQYWAPVNFVFQTFRFMVYLGVSIMALVAAGLLLWARGKLFDLSSLFTRVFLICLLPSVALPIAASQLGWAAAEVGRQPWIVWHILKTKDAVTTLASPGEILFSIIMFTAIFTFITVVFSAVFLRMIKAGPKDINQY